MTHKLVLANPILTLLKSIDIVTLLYLAIQFQNNPIIFSLETYVAHNLTL